MLLSQRSFSRPESFDDEVEGCCRTELGTLVDSFGRIAKKLRISVTDRCNFKCSFCMPIHPVWLPHSEILSFEEIVRLARIFASMGVDKIRLSGGEPLVRKDIERLVQMLVQDAGIPDVNMTTNGYFLADKAQALKNAGMKGVTVSLHSLKPERFEMITGKGAYEKVLEGIKASKRVGLTPLKINAVVTRGCNDDEVLDLARMAWESEVTVRFIEYMPFDGAHIWNMEKLVTGKEIIGEIKKEFKLVQLPRKRGSTAIVYKFLDSPGEIGVITSMSAPFCSDCDRVRLKADGKIVPCLFSSDEYDVKPLLRNGASDEELATFIKGCFLKKSPGVEALLKRQAPLLHIRPMHTIGG